jgi:hypothetical protein
MNAADLRRRIQNIMGDDSGIFFETVDLYDLCNDAQMDIVRKTEILRTSAQISMIAAQPEYPLPVDFIVEKRVTYQGIRMKKTTIEEIDDWMDAKDDPSTAGNASFYYIVGNKIGFYPTPVGAVANAVRVTYVKAPVLLAADVDIPEIPVHMHEDIIRYVLGRAREQSEQFDVAQAIMGDYDKRLGLSKDQAQSQAAASYPVIRDYDSNDMDTSVW